MAGCLVIDCTQPHYARGVCTSHYHRWRNGDATIPTAPLKVWLPQPACSIEGCDRQAKSRGWCQLHYARWRLNGHPLKLVRHGPPEERFWRWVNQSGPVSEMRPDLGSCWLWTGSHVTCGYGLFRKEKGSTRSSLAHRFAYTMLVGEIPEDYEIDHLCCVRDCVNPEHLEAVTPAENRRRRIAVKPRRPWKRQTHCVNGHEYTPENTYVNARSGWRFCRICKRAAFMKWYASKRAAASAQSSCLSVGAGGVGSAALAATGVGGVTRVTRASL